MDVLHARCCGLDVHKSSISACIMLREAGRVQKHQHRFGAMTQDLRELAERLQQFRVTQVGMESSGVYWKPVWNILEGQFTRGNYFDRIHSDGLKRYLVKRLQQLGHKVTLEPMEAA
ncbi:MAG TPA: transposase [Terriglobales bacterium]